MTEGEVAERAYKALIEAQKLGGKWATVAALHFLDRHGAGFPDVPLQIERVRDDAAGWAASAHDLELEAYIGAALQQLKQSVLTDRAARRLAALGFSEMNQESRDLFLRWAGEQ